MENDSLYGTLKRLRFFERHIRNQSPKNVLELGCGTGEGLLLPLAKQFPAIQFAGLDSHKESIDYAQSKATGLSNLKFYRTDADEPPANVVNQQWDMVIASEMLEHCADPFAVLKTASSLLTENGRLMITVPNGYGPFEWEKFLWELFGFEKILHAWRRHRAKNSVLENPTTLNDSNTHVCFFSWGDLNRLIETAGFEIEEHENREFFCGPFSDLAMSVLKRVGLGGLLVGLSQGSARFLPPHAVSDWMMSARKTKAPEKNQWVVPPQNGFKKWWWTTKRRLNAGASH